MGGGVLQNQRFYNKTLQNRRYFWAMINLGAVVMNGRTEELRVPPPRQRDIYINPICKSKLLY